MSEQFYKGRTNNHLTWVMVDATDFATPESALSAATKIKIYGKLRGATGVNFVSSGTGSLTNDIQHVGASVLGIYTIALAKADLSDASAAWYDTYIISLSATGAAYQALVADGGIDQSAILAFSDAISNAYSAAVVGTSRVLLVQSRLSDLDSRLASEFSDVYSMLTAQSDAVSNAYSAAVVGASRILLVQSRLSDLDSRLASEFSDVYSMLTAQSDAVSNAYSAAVVGASRILLVQSRLSDLDSRLVSDVSDLLSAVRGNSDFLSKMSDVLSNAYSAAAVGASRILLVQSRLSDFDSRLASELSDIYSAITGITVTLTASDISDIASAVAATAGLLTTSEMSDIASQVWAHAVGTRVDSRLLVAQSVLSDIRSHVSDLQSDFQSRVPKRVATDSQLSDLASDLRSVALVAQSQASDIYSLLSDLHSDVGVISGVVSDIYSGLSDFVSDFGSALAEPTTAPTATPTIKQAIAWHHALSRNKILQTATVQSLRNDADSADIASAAVSDDGTTFTRGEFGN